MAASPGAPVSAEALAGVSLFAGLARRDRALLAALMRDVSFPAGTEMTSVGHDGVVFFVVAEGRAVVQVGGETRRILGVGDYFGEMALIDRAPQSARVVAQSDIRCYGLAAWNFKPFVREHPDVAWTLLETLVSRLREAESRA